MRAKYQRIKGRITWSKSNYIPNCTCSIKRSQYAASCKQGGGRLEGMFLCSIPFIYIQCNCYFFLPFSFFILKTRIYVLSWHKSNLLLHDLMGWIFIPFFFHSWIMSFLTSSIFALHDEICNLKGVVWMFH